jgi:alkylhydroperoxidase family enzyme
MFSMSWLDPNVESLADALALSPAGPAFEEYRQAVRADEAADPALLALCRQRMAHLLGVPAGDAGPGARPDLAALTPRERAALAFAEQWLLDPAGMTDGDCTRLRAHLGDAAAAAFTMGLAVVEAELRVALALGVRP